MPFDPNQPFETVTEEASPQPELTPKPAFDPNQAFEPVEQAAAPADPYAPVFTPYEKATAAAGAEFYTAPKQGAQFLDFVRTMFYKPVDMVLGTKISDSYAGRMAQREKEINVERGYAQEASGTGELAQLSQGVAQQLTQLPVQMAAGGLGLAVKGIKGAIAASSAFGGLQSAENSFATNVERRVAAGEDVHDAANAEILPALTSGVITAAVTRGFGATGIESIFKTGGAKSVVGKFAEVLKQGGAEVAEEVTDEATQIMNDLVSNKKVTPQEAFDRVKQTIYLSAIMGGGATAVHQFAPQPAKTEASKIVAEGAQVADDLEKNAAPQTAEVVRQESERDAAIAARAGALRAAMNPELRQQQAAAGSQENFVEGTFPEEAAPPPEIKLTTKQSASGVYDHQLSIAPETTAEQLTEWQKQVDLSHLPVEAQAAVKAQIDAALVARQPAAPAVPATAEPAPAPAAQKPAPPTVIPAEPSLAMVPQTTAPHVISTAINTPEGLLTGGTWNEPHEGVGIRHGLDEVPQEQRGFLIQDAEGNQRFTTRAEAGAIAKAAGQTLLPDPSNLQSSDLTNMASPLAKAATRGLGRTYNETPLPTAAEVARLAARTPEEKAAQVETGTQSGLAEAEASGQTLTTAEAHRLTGDAAAGKKLRTTIAERFAALFPSETLPEGTTEVPTNTKTDKSKLTGDILRFVKAEDGTVRPLFTNEPQDMAQHVDNGTRVVVPDDLVKAKKVNPAIKYALDAKTGEYVVTDVDTKLPNGRVINVSEPDQFTEAYREAKIAKGDEAPDLFRFSPEDLAVLQEKMEKGAKDRGIDIGSLDFNEDEADLQEPSLSDPGQKTDLEEVDLQEALGESDGDIPGPSLTIPGKSESTSDGVVDITLTNYADLNRLGITEPEKVKNPMGVALKKISTDVKLTARQRILAKVLLKVIKDWSPVQLTVTADLKNTSAGTYSPRSGVTQGAIDVNPVVGHRGGVVATLLHEAVHHATTWKVDPRYKRNAFEEKAYQKLLKYYDKALAHAFEVEMGRKGSLAELQEFADAQAVGETNGKYPTPGKYYGLRDIREFVAESLSSDDFNQFLSEIEGEGPVRGPVGKVSSKLGDYLTSVRDTLKQLFTGEPVKPGSLLDNAVDDAFKLLRHKQKASRFNQQPLPETVDMKSVDQMVKNRARDLGLSDEDMQQMTQQDIQDYVKRGGTAPAEATATLRADADQWVGPDGKVIDANVDGGHYNAGLGLIDSDPKLRAAYDAAVKKDPNKFLESRTWVEPFLEKQGFVRVLGGSPGTETYINGKPTAKQKQMLIDAAQKVGNTLIWEQDGGSTFTLYSPSFASKAASLPELTHEIGADGRTRHGLNVPSDATIEGLNAARAQVEASTMPDVDKARIIAQINTEIETRESQTNDVSAIEEDPSKWRQFFNKTAERIAAHMKAEGDLPINVFRRWLDREGQVKAISRDIAYTTSDFYTALREVYKINRLEQATKGFSSIPKSDIDLMNNVLLGKASPDALPEPLRGPLTEMRAQIDSLSKMLIDEGLAVDDLAVKVTENLGTYLTRSYRIFEDPKWANKIPSEVRNRAKAFLLSELRKDNPAATTEDAQRKMDSMLEDWRTQGDERFNRATGRLGAQDFSTFIKRKDISPEIRALMGEYTDPVTNYARSITKMAHLIESNRFLKSVREMGMGKFLYEEGTQPPGHDALIAAEANAPMAPLNGLRTTPEIAAAFQEFGKAMDPGGLLFRSYMKATALAKASKTVGSIMTQARNAEQFWFFGMNGHYDVTPLKEAFASTAADIGITNSPKWRGFYKNMLRMNVVDQSAKANELRDTINDATLSGFSQIMEPTRAGVAKNVGSNLFKGTVGAAVRAYQISDDVGKVVGFMNERKRQAALQGLTLQDPTDPNWVPNAADIKAAQIITLTYPTYSMVPNWVKNLRRQPVFGPFMTFSYEAMRTTYHNLSITSDYLREAAKPETANRAEYTKAAAQRLGGQIAVLGGLTSVVSLATRALLGLTADEEEDARKFLPEWDKNSQLAFIGKDKGQLQYINLSYQNPYSYITDPVLAVTRSIGEGNGVMNAVVQGAKEFLQPFSNESVLAGAVLDIARNKTSTGRPVYNEADTEDQKIRAVLARLYETVEPGTLTRLRKKFIPAARGETRGNLKLDLSQELTSEITGFKTQTLDYKQGLGFKASDFVENERESERIFRSVVLREGNVTPEEITESYQRAEAQRFQIWKDLHEVAVAGIRRGLTSTEVRTLMKARRVSSADAALILRGTYKPFKPTGPMKTQLRVMLKRQLPPLVSPFAGKRLSDSPTQPAQIEPPVAETPQ